MDQRNKTSDIVITMKDPEYETTTGHGDRPFIEEEMRLIRAEKREKIKALAKDLDPDAAVIAFYEEYARTHRGIHDLTFTRTKNGVLSVSYKWSADV